MDKVEQDIILREQLRSVLNVIDTKGWIRGAFQMNDGVCLIGAVGIVEDGDAYTPGKSRSNLYDALYEALPFRIRWRERDRRSLPLRRLYRGKHHRDVLMEYNDTHVEKEVRELIEKALRKVEKRIKATELSEKEPEKALELYPILPDLEVPEKDVPEEVSERESEKVLV